MSETFIFDAVGPRETSFLDLFDTFSVVFATTLVGIFAGAFDGVLTGLGGVIAGTEMGSVGITGIDVLASVLILPRVTRSREYADGMKCSRHIYVQANNCKENGNI